jgi:hypothetical protein
MKKSNFLKILFASLFVITMIGFFACEEKPACEKNNTCTVKVVNNTSYFIYVDVTYCDDDFNDERQLGFSQSTTYTMKPGCMTVWAIKSTDYSSNVWNYDDIYVDQCTDYKYTWTSGKKGETTLTITDGDSKVYEEGKGKPKNK